MDRRRRVDLQGILASPDLRRELMVHTIQATQAREGIETTREQAERAYYVVTEGERTAFFDLQRFRDVDGMGDLRQEMFELALVGRAEKVRFDVARRDFGSIEGSPLAYRRVGLVSRIFKDVPALDPAYAEVVVGLQTSADDRFVHHHWEVPVGTIGEGKSWVPFAKGGEFSRFYADVYLVVNWENSGAELRTFKGAYIRNEQHYFKPGLTWPYAAGAFNVRWLPPGCVFGHKGPAVIPKSINDTAYLAGVVNARVAEYLLMGLTSRQSLGGRWEVGVIKRLPIPEPTSEQRERISTIATSIHDAKASWDKGNETSTRFRTPWLLREELVGNASSIGERLEHLAEYEAAEEARIRDLYAELNDVVYDLYEISAETRAMIEETLGERPPEVLWPKMEGKTSDQKRMEHIFRVLSYAVRSVVAKDEDGIVPFASVAGEDALIDRLREEIQSLFPKQEVGKVEAEIVNELRRKVKGYPSTQSLEAWLENAYFAYHSSLHRGRPVIWHIASRQGTARSAFGVLVDYHRFDGNQMAKLRAQYLRDVTETFRREAALADKEGRTERRLEWQNRLEETEELDRQLQLVQEGRVNEVGKDDYRILTPWKTPEERPKGWAPDLDDGVKVNILPLQNAHVLRLAEVV